MPEKKKITPAYITMEDEDGNVLARYPMTEADCDWIRAARLQRKANQGDKEAAKKLNKMQSSQMNLIEDADD